MFHTSFGRGPGLVLLLCLDYSASEAARTACDISSHICSLDCLPKTRLSADASLAHMVDQMMSFEPCVLYQIDIASEEDYFISDGFLFFNHPTDSSGCCTAEASSTL